MPAIAVAVVARTPQAVPGFLPKAAPAYSVHRRPYVHLVQFTLVEVGSLHVSAVPIAHPLIMPEILPPTTNSPVSALATSKTLVPVPPPPVAPDEEAPRASRDDDDHQDDLPALAVGLPLGGVQFRLLGLLVRRAVARGAAHRRLGPFLAVQPGVGRVAADAADVDAHESVEHVACPAGVVKGHHVAGVVEEDIGEIPGLLVEPGRLALEGPVAAGRPRAGGQLEAPAAVELHVGDERLGAQVVADEVLGAGEEEHGDLGEDVGEELDRGLRLFDVKRDADVAVAFHPAGGLVGIDVERVDHILAAEVGGDLVEVGRPVHAAGWKLVGKADIIHVVAFALAVWAHLGREPEEVLEDGLAGRDIDGELFQDGEFLLADAKLRLQLSGDSGSFF